MPDAAVGLAFDLPPREALSYFTRLGLVPTGPWDELWQTERTGAFTVAHLARLDILADIVWSPALRPEDQGEELRPWIDPENFNPGYLMRGMHLLPKSGDKPDWRHTQDYWNEKDEIPAIDLDDKAFQYS